MYCLIAWLNLETLVVFLCGNWQLTNWFFCNFCERSENSWLIYSKLQQPPHYWWELVNWNISVSLLDEKLHSLVGCWDLHLLLIYIAHKKMIWVEGTDTMAGLAWLYEYWCVTESNTPEECDLHTESKDSWCVPKCHWDYCLGQKGINACLIEGARGKLREREKQNAWDYAKRCK